MSNMLRREQHAALHGVTYYYLATVSRNQKRWIGRSSKTTSAPRPRVVPTIESTADKDGRENRRRRTIHAQPAVQNHMGSTSSVANRNRIGKTKVENRAFDYKYRNRQFLGRYFDVGCNALLSFSSGRVSSTVFSCACLISSSFAIKCLRTVNNNTTRPATSSADE